MVVETAGMKGAGRQRAHAQPMTRSDSVLAASMAFIILVTLTAWIVFKDELAKYILYTLPFTLSAVYLIVNEGRIKLHRPGVVALGLYLTCAIVSIVANNWFGFFAIRDVAIIGGYLFLFVLWFRAPASTADICLVALIIGMLVEAATEGFGEEVNLFGSQGILESTLAFPIGVITLYYLHARKWGRAFIAAIWLFLAFKRIAFLALPAALIFDMAIGRYIRPSRARPLAFQAVFVLSLISLFSTQIFDYVALTLKIANTSANSISLGRHDMAMTLWSDLSGSSIWRLLFGAGPGAADSVLVIRLARVEASNPHNDWLKIFFDYGAFGFIIMHAVLFRVLCEHRLGVMLYIYGAVLMMTDNVFIYMFYHPFVLLMVAAAREGPRDALAKGSRR